MLVEKDHEFCIIKCMILRSRRFLPFLIAFFGLLLLAPGSASASQFNSILIHEPYVQLGDAPLPGFADSNHDQVDIMWQTGPDIDPIHQDTFEVSYREASSTEWNKAPYISTINIGIDEKIIHSTTIYGLEFDKEYDYKVDHIRDGKILKSYLGKYRTRIAAGNPTPFTFVAYGDSANENPPKDFISVQKKILEMKPRFSVLLGDNAYTDGSYGQFDLRLDQSINSIASQWVRNHLDVFGWGNHDIITLNGRPALDNYSSPKPVAGVTARFAPPITETPEKNFSFDYGGVHFVTFDSNSNNNPARLKGLLDWVAKDLDESKATWKILFFHHPLLTVSTSSMSKNKTYNEDVLRVARDHGVDVILTGHAHSYERSYPITTITSKENGSGYDVAMARSLRSWYLKGSGVAHVVSGLGGRNTLDSGNFDAPWLGAVYTTNTPQTSKYGFLSVKVTPSALTLSQYSAADGKILDTFTIGNGTEAKPLPDYPKGTPKNKMVMGNGAVTDSVRIIQQILNLDPETQVATSGEGSPGNESNKYGMSTEGAVRRFQEKYGLARKGMASYGKVDLATRAKLNEIALAYLNQK